MQDLKINNNGENSLTEQTEINLNTKHNNTTFEISRHSTIKTSLEVIHKQTKRLHTEVYRDISNRARVKNHLNEIEETLFLEKEKYTTEDIKRYIENVKELFKLATKESDISNLVNEHIELIESKYTSLQETNITEEVNDGVSNALLDISFSDLEIRTLASLVKDALSNPLLETSDEEVYHSLIDKIIKSSHK